MFDDWDDWDIRVQATFIIWFMFLASLLIVGIFNPGGQDASTAIAILATIGAALSTVTVWAMVSVFGAPERAAMQREKQKRKMDALQGNRDSRTALLLELMDDHERAALKRRLMDDLRSDGEISLADLLEEQESRAQSRGRR